MNQGSFLSKRRLCTFTLCWTADRGVACGEERGETDVFAG